MLQIEPVENGYIISTDNWKGVATSRTSALRQIGDYLRAHEAGALNPVPLPHREPEISTEPAQVAVGVQVAQSPVRSNP